MSIELEQLQHIIEAVLMSADEPLSINKLDELFNEEDQVTPAAIKEAVELIQGHYSGRGVELVEVATGFRFQTRADVAPWLQKRMLEKPPKMSRAMLETLALIAYKQPITRAEIEDVRGVVVSTNIIKSLTEREWIRVIGHRDVPGKPSLFATTKTFLDDLNLTSLAQLPTLSELKNLDELDSGAQMQLDMNPELSDEQKAAAISEAAHAAADFETPDVMALPALSVGEIVEAIHAVAFEQEMDVDVAQEDDQEIDEEIEQDTALDDEWVDEDDKLQANESDEAVQDTHLYEEISESDESPGIGEGLSPEGSSEIAGFIPAGGYNQIEDELGEQDEENDELAQPEEIAN